MLLVNPQNDVVYRHVPILQMRKWNRVNYLARASQLVCDSVRPQSHGPP